MKTLRQLIAPHLPNSIRYNARLAQLATIPQQIRNNLIRPFNQLPLKGVGMEVGVDRGHNAYKMLNRHPEITKLYLIDPYTSYWENKHYWDDGEERKKAAIKRLKKFAHKIEWLSEIPDKQSNVKLNFVYIDGNHEYKYVERDIYNAYKLMKINGLIGGHDFMNDFPGVIRAVTNWTSWNTENLKVVQPDWWFIKT